MLLMETVFTPIHKDLGLECGFNCFYTHSSVGHCSR